MKIRSLLLLAGLSVLFQLMPELAGVGFAASLPFQERVRNFDKVARFTKGGQAYQAVLSYEGQFVNSFNEQIDTFIQRPMDKTWLADLNQVLSKHKTLEIQLTKEGFAQAADRATDGDADATNYDAIWVRDSVWVYLSYVETDQFSKASTLINKLVEYYSSEPQVARFKAVIESPSLKANPMLVPHIRFDGKSKDLRDVYIHGSAQTWNHKQLDAHGLFLEALLDAVARPDGEIRLNQSSEQLLTLSDMLVTYFLKVEYWDYEESGAWEELDRKNSSSIAIVARSLKKLSMMRSGFFQKSSFTEQDLDKLYSKGLSTVQKQIKLGGESPDYADPRSPKFRKADAALLNLLLPYPLPGLSETELRSVVKTIEGLKRESGILRYDLDSYQSANYWIVDPSQSNGHQEELEAIAITDEGFRKRLSGFIPNSEAQWFFDSKMAWMKIVLAEMTDDPQQKAIDLFEAKVSLKRAIGQITGNRGGRHLITADGSVVEEFLLPESINTVLIDDKSYLLPSPITPLNWAKAGLAISMSRIEGHLQ